MIQLIDQRNRSALKFRCTDCGQEFTQATRSFLELHSTRESLGDGGVKLAHTVGVPLCDPALLVKSAPEVPRKRGRPPVVKP